jgi:hypothetical protein
MLHVVETSPANPTPTDGILIPRISNFPSVNPPTAGNLVMLRKTAGTRPAFQTKPDGFYFWNGNEWIMLLTKTESAMKQKVYVACGQSFGAMGTGERRPVALTVLTYDGTNVPANEKFTLANNTLTVGKAGTYLVSLIVGSRRGNASNTGTAEQQTNLIAEVLVNGASKSPAIKGQSNTSAEILSACQVIVNALVTLNKGDQLSVYVLQQPLTAALPYPIPYTVNGLSSLTLYYLHN